MAANDPFGYLDRFTPAGAASDPALMTLIQQIVARYRARLAANPSPVIQIPGVTAPSGAAPASVAAPAPSYTPPPAPAPTPVYRAPAPAPIAPAVAAAPTGVPALGTGGNTPWTAAAYGGAAPTPGTAAPAPAAAFAGMGLFPQGQGGGVNWNPDPNAWSYAQLVAAGLQDQNSTHDRYGDTGAGGQTAADRGMG